MPKYLQILVALVCLAILIPIALSFIGFVSMLVGIVVLALMELGDGLGKLLAPFGWLISIVGFAVIGWLFVRARHRPIPGSAPQVVGLGSPSDE